jgi:hypothetical protein
MTTEILSRPVSHGDKGPKFWIDEAIWGHRLHDEQTPWLTVLEFLGILQSEATEGRALIEAAPNTLSYKPQQQLKLRNLLFNNRHLAVVQSEIRQDEDRWTTWLERMNASAGGIDRADFSYLRKHFNSFQDFVSVVEFLQRSAIEGGSNKRWSSKFVFPFGGHALYEDVDISPSNGVSIDRRFFGRTGEVLYLMLSRSRQVDALRDALTRRLLSSDNTYNRLVGILQGKPDYGRDRDGAYVPYAHHPAFDRIAEDWIALLASRVPAYDIIPHLVAMTGLNLILYQLDRARETLKGQEPVSLVWEIIGPKRTKLRVLSEKSYQVNDVLPGQAIEAHIRAVTDTQDWKNALAEEDPKSAATDVLTRIFYWPDSDDDTAGTPDEMISQLVQLAMVRHRQHVGNCHRTWSRQIGLSSRRSSRSTRYAPTDRLLKTMVVTCVNGRMEYKAFLDHLARRYGIIIGDHQATGFIESGSADQEDFSDNGRRLEERLASLGLLERFSDSCAYVVNPFDREPS